MKYLPKNKFRDPHKFASKCMSRRISYNSQTVDKLSECLDKLEDINPKEREAFYIYNVVINTTELCKFFTKTKYCSEIGFSKCIINSSSVLDFETGLNGCRFHTILFKE
jgi:ribosomal protein L15